MRDVQRHRTAIGRNRFSKPVRLALEHGLIRDGDTFLDYGCGRGDDVRRLRSRGQDAVGWDPAHRPDGERRPSAVVNMGFVLNVIENREERTEALHQAWRLAERTLVVAALTTVGAKTKAVPFGDGVMTSRGTFQKAYRHSDLEQLVREATGTEPVALALGVFAVTRDPAERARLFSSRFSERRLALRPEQANEVFLRNRESMEPLLRFVEVHGRLPAKKECSQFHVLKTTFGTVAAAGRLLRTVLPPTEWERAAQNARDSISLLLALSKFDQRPRMSDLSVAQQGDIRAHFGAYKSAVELADSLLSSLGTPGQTARAARTAQVGKLLPDSLYVHIDSLSELPITLRLFEGCARRYVGSVDDANVVKLMLRRPTVTYLTYPEFARAPHPALTHSLRVDLRRFEITATDYSVRTNPPILHRKELFVHAMHPDRPKFARLTRQEEKAGLLSDTHRIGHREAWQARLDESGYRLKGHRLVRARNDSSAGERPL